MFKIKSEKILSLALTVIFLFSFCVCAFAVDEKIEYGNTYTIMTADGPKSMINNMYYKIYYDRIFEAEYDSLSYYSLDGMTQLVIGKMNDNEFSYVTVILNEKVASETFFDYNKLVLSEIDVVYAGNTTPLSVVKINRAEALELLENENVSAIFPAFFCSDPTVNFIVGNGIMGDADSSSEITSADARKILRYSAGLVQIDEDEAKRFYFQSDINFDGNITAADARLVLRTAANLCDKNEIYLPYANYWKDF